MPERKFHKVQRHRHPPRTEAQITYELGRRLLQKPKHTQEALRMEVNQVVFEYGKLHLNFVACQQQNVQLATALANANKTGATLTADKGKALARVTQLEVALKSAGIAIPDVPSEPEPPKEPIGGITGAASNMEQAPGPRVVTPAKPSTEN